MTLVSVLLSIQLSIPYCSMTTPPESVCRWPSRIAVSRIYDIYKKDLRIIELKTSRSIHAESVLYHQEQIDLIKHLLKTDYVLKGKEYRVYELQSAKVTHEDAVYYHQFQINLIQAELLTLEKEK